MDPVASTSHKQHELDNDIKTPEHVFFTSGTEITSNSTADVCTGYFNGFNVEIRLEQDKSNLYQLGCYGKSAVSRFNVNITDSIQILRERQYLKRKLWFKKFRHKYKTGKTPKLDDNLTLENVGMEICNDTGKRSNDSISNNKKVIVVPDSDSDREDYLKNIKPKCCASKIEISDKLFLSLQEAFYVHFVEDCLHIFDEENSLLSTEQCWDLFQKVDKNFIEKYVVYHYYKSKDYIIKTGVKFGGDYLLYKGKPNEVHADYIVVIKYKKEVYNLSWISVLAHIRTATTTLKELLVVEVVEDGNKQNIFDLSKYTVRQVLLKRCTPSNKDVAE